MYRFEASLVDALASSGVRFMAGTDAANPLMVAGFSLHDELETLARDTRLSTFDVLLAATMAPAQFLHDGRAGYVGVDARADLVLVDGNPLRDLTILRRPTGVVLGGRWLARATLDSLLGSVKRFR
jgi:imidazolonepropionase-like amidohydrolase